MIPVNILAFHGVPGTVTDSPPTSWRLSRQAMWSATVQSRTGLSRVLYTREGDCLARLTLRNLQGSFPEAIAKNGILPRCGRI